jgi:hypothetical protein
MKNVGGIGGVGVRKSNVGKSHSDLGGFIGFFEVPR